MADQDQVLKVRAESDEGLAYIASALQDALIQPKDLQFDAPARRFALVASRYRWETQVKPKGLFSLRPPPSRIRSFVRFDYVDTVRSRQFDAASTVPLNLLSISAQAKGEGYDIRLIFSGGTDILLSCDSIDVTLDDVGAPWRAKAVPRHDD